MFENIAEVVTQTEEFKVWVAIVVTAVGAISALISSGVAWGKLSGRIKGLEDNMTKAEKNIKSTDGRLTNMIEDGIFVREDVCDMRNVHSDERHTTVLESINKLQGTCDDIKDTIHEHIVKNAGKAKKEVPGKEV
jgi:hypothetical protein